MAEVENAYKILVGNFDGKIHVWRRTLRWENNIKLYLVEATLQYEVFNWMKLAQNIDQRTAVVNIVINPVTR
jgi:hypothetical protein